MATWPVTLPQAFDNDGYSYEPAENRIISSMDAGAGKQRQKYTAVPFFHSGKMLMTMAQLSTFRAFVANDIGYANDFVFPNPLDSGLTDITVRFSPMSSPPYKIVPDSPNYVTVAFQLMETIA